MLTSKDVLDRTGISRATLNNYIASGLLPRPDVLPPGPEHGAAPRIGFFPDGTVERVLEIQRLKREGWSIARIAAHFGTGLALAAPVAPVPAGAPPVAAARPVPVPIERTRTAAPAAPESPAVSLAGIRGPAFLLDDRFAPAWVNDAALADPGSPLQGLRRPLDPATVLGRLLSWLDDPAVLPFVAGLAGQRQLPAGQLAALAEPRLWPALHDAYEARDGLGARPVAQVLLAGPPHDVHVLQAVHFREGVLFVVGGTPQGRATTATGAPPGPALLPVAVLVATLRDAQALWLRLPAREFFALVGELGAELDGIFGALGGRHSGHPADGMACHFVGDGSGDHLAHALEAADLLRQAVRRVNGRWRERKGWDLDLALGTGLDAGHEWVGALRPAEPATLTVLGGAADQARALSQAARAGAVWMTRGLVDRLPAGVRERVRYGVPRPDGKGGMAAALESFARLQDLRDSCGGGVVPLAFADLPVTELIEIAPPGPTPSQPGPAGA